MTTITLEYIELDDRGNAKLIGSRVKVIHLIMAQKANSWSAEQLCEQYPHLPPAAIYSALAYYHKNRELMDRQIEEHSEYARRMEATHPDQPSRQDLLERLIQVKVATINDPLDVRKLYLRKGATAGDALSRVGISTPSEFVTINGRAERATTLLRDGDSVNEAISGLQNVLQASET